MTDEEIDLFAEYLQVVVPLDRLARQVDPEVLDRSWQEKLDWYRFQTAPPPVDRVMERRVPTSGEVGRLRRELGSAAELALIRHWSTYPRSTLGPVGSVSLGDLPSGADLDGWLREKPNWEPAFWGDNEKVMSRNSRIRFEIDLQEGRVE